MNRLSENDHKIESLHFKRLSNAQIKTSCIDKLLLTQNFKSFHRINHKHKLPQINTQNPINSKNKLNQTHHNLQNLAQKLKFTFDQLHRTKIFASQIELNMVDKLNKLNNMLKNKIDRLEDAIKYSIDEYGKRTGQIQKDCERVADKSSSIRRRIEKLKQRMRLVQIQSGIYTGEDKYLL